ncbi:MAG: ricin-type beta-trefoil lectin domain protein [Candidatus Rariloculaceae bacterium]
MRHQTSASPLNLEAIARMLPLTLVGCALLIAQPAVSAEPELQTPEPVIYLADNLDEQDNLGWCIDTLGRGWSEQLQTHSCKPQGGDVQFSYNEETGQIASVEFPGKCATLHESAAAGVSFDLLDCSADSAEQRFTYNAETSEFMPNADQSLCVAAGAASQSAGPFMSRILELAPCASTDLRLKQWVIKGSM